MTIVLEHHTDDTVLAGEWDALADELHAPPWLRPGWHRAWWTAFGAGTREVIAVREKPDLVGVLPVRRHFGAVFSPTNWHTPEYGFLVRPSAAGAMASALFEHRPRRISLGFLDAGQPGFPELVASATLAGYRQITRLLEKSPYVDLRGGWQSYESTRDAKLMRELRRRRRRLDAIGKVRFEVVRGGRSLDDRLAEGFRVEAAGWKGEAHTAIASNEATRRFYREVARWAQQRGMLRLAFLRVGDDAIAFDLAMEDERHHYLLKTGFDPSYRHVAPGMLLRHEMIRRTFDSGLDTYEFLGADEPWKLQWADHLRERLLVQAFAPTPTGLVDWSAYAIGRPLAKRVLAVGRR